MWTRDVCPPKVADRSTNEAHLRTDICSYTGNQLWWLAKTSLAEHLQASTAGQQIAPSLHHILLRLMIDGLRNGRTTHCEAGAKDRGFSSCLFALQRIALTCVCCCGCFCRQHSCSAQHPIRLVAAFFVVINTPEDGVSTFDAPVVLSWVDEA